MELISASKVRKIWLIEYYNQPPLRGYWISEMSLTSLMPDVVLQTLNSMFVKNGTRALFAYLLTICLAPIPYSLADSSNEKPWTWSLDFGKSPEKVSDSLINDLANQAVAGDMRLKRQFARAYFGCKELTYKERCQAMRARPDLGEKFLKEIVNLIPPENDRWEKEDVGDFQAMYARLLFREAAPEFDPESTICREAVKYSLLAMDNGASCIARYFKDKSYFGLCIKKNDPKYESYYQIIDPCPIV